MEFETCSSRGTAGISLYVHIMLSSLVTYQIVTMIMMHVHKGLYMFMFSCEACSCILHSDTYFCLTCISMHQLLFKAQNSMLSQIPKSFPFFIALCNKAFSMMFYQQSLQLNDLVGRDTHRHSPSAILMEGSQVIPIHHSQVEWRKVE